MTTAHASPTTDTTSAKPIHLLPPVKLSVKWVGPLVHPTVNPADATQTLDAHVDAYVQEVSPAQGMVWEPCDVGQPDGSRAMDFDHRVCFKGRSPSGPWLHADHHLLKTITREMLGPAGVDIQAGVSFHPDMQQVLRYTPGCFFREHEDRVLGPDHLGTLLLILPSPDLVGGILGFEDGREMSCPGTRVAFPGTYLVFIPLGVVHWVTLVVAGHRIVAKAPVFGKVSTKRSASRAD